MYPFVKPLLFCLLLGCCFTVANAAEGRWYSSIVCDVPNSGPYGMVLDADGNIYYSENRRHIITRISSVDGSLTLIAGMPDKSGSSDGPGIGKAQFKEPTGLLIVDNILYVMDSGNDHVRYIDLSNPSFPVSTWQGPAFPPLSPIPHLVPRGIDLLVDTSKSYIFLSGANSHLIDRYTRATNAIEIFVGSLQGNDDGKSAKFYRPQGLVWKDSETIIVCDGGNAKLRTVNIMTKWTDSYFGATPETKGLLKDPSHILIDTDGSYLVTDYGAHSIVRIDKDAKNLTLEFGSGNGYREGYNDSASGGLQFSGPRSIIRDKDGHLLVADSGNNKIRRIINCTKFPTLCPTPPPTTTAPPVTTSAPTAPPATTSSPRIPTSLPTWLPTSLPTSSPTTLPPIPTEEPTSIPDLTVEPTPSTPPPTPMKSNTSNSSTMTPTLIPAPLNTSSPTNTPSSTNRGNQSQSNTTNSPPSNNSTNNPTTTNGTQNSTSTVQPPPTAPPPSSPPAPTSTPQPPNNSTQETDFAGTVRNNAVSGTKVLADFGIINSPGSVMLAGQLSSIARLQECTTQGFQSLDYAEHPTRLTLTMDGPPPAGLYAGAALANSVIVIAMWCLMRLASHVYPKFEKTFMSIALRVQLFLLPGTITAASYVVTNLRDHGGFMGLGVGILLVHSACVVYFSYILLFRFRAHPIAVPAPVNHWTLTSLYNFIVWKEMRWADVRDTTNDGIPADVSFVRRFGPLFSPYRQGREWYCLVDMILGTLFACVLGITTLPCETIVGVLCAIQYGMMLSLWLTWPRHTRLDYGLAAVIESCKAVLLPISTLPPGSPLGTLCTVLWCVIAIVSGIRIIILIIRKIHKLRKRKFSLLSVNGNMSALLADEEDSEYVKDPNSNQRPTKPTDAIDTTTSRSSRYETRRTSLTAKPHKSPSSTPVLTAASTLGDETSSDYISADPQLSEVDVAQPQTRTFQELMNSRKSKIPKSPRVDSRRNTMITSSSASPSTLLHHDVEMGSVDGHFPSSTSSHHRATMIDHARYSSGSSPTFNASHTVPLMLEANGFNQPSPLTLPMNYNNYSSMLWNGQNAGSGTPHGKRKITSADL
eukprot:PhF_6_TR36383/c2_g1_i4/m.53473